MTDDDDDGHRADIFARAFSVFNAAQVDGYERPPSPVLPESERLAHAEAFTANLGVKTVSQQGGSLLSPVFRYGVHAAVSPRFFAGRHVILWRLAARVVMPAEPSTGSIEISLAALDRQPMPLKSAAWRFSVGLLLADLGIAHHPRPDHAACVASWLKVAKDDPKAIFTAASKAQQAANTRCLRSSPKPRRWQRDQHHLHRRKISQRGWTVRISSRDDAAFFCASLGIVPTVRHADYIGSWLDVLREDNRAIVRAASQASKAADFLLGFLPGDNARASIANGREAA